MVSQSVEINIIYILFSYQFLEAFHRIFGLGYTVPIRGEIFGQKNQTFMIPNLSDTYYSALMSKIICIYTIFLDHAIISCVCVL